MGLAALHGSSLFSGRYDTPWQWTATQSNFSMDVTRRADRQLPVDVSYQTIRPTATEEEIPLDAMTGLPDASYGGSADAFMNIIFSPLSSGEYGAAHTWSSVVTLGQDVSNYLGGYVELAFYVGIGWDNGVSRPDGGITLTLDVSEVITDAIFMPRAVYFFGGLYEAVLRVVGVLTGRRNLKFTAQWHTTWVHGEAQDLSGTFTLSSTLTTVRAYIKQHLLPGEDSAARGQSGDPDWEIV